MMTRRLILFLITLPIVTLASYPLFSNSGSAAPGLHLEQGEFWRLPWRAGVEHSVSGYGYGEETHSATGTYDPDDRYALDLGVPAGHYVMAIQEGYISDVVLDDPAHYGKNVKVVDVGGFESRYAHFSSTHLTEQDELK